MQISRSVMAIGGVVVAAGMIGFTNPKTVHALAAALVQVTNTASNPVVTQGVGQQAGQMIHLWCLPGVRGPLGDCVVARVAGSPYYGTQYSVPQGQTLVITAMDILPYGNYVPGCNFTHRDTLTATDTADPDDGATQVWSLPSLATVHMAYPSGLLFHSSVTLSESVDGYPSSAPADCLYNDQIDLYGYLTAN